MGHSRRARIRSNPSAVTLLAFPTLGLQDGSGARTFGEKPALDPRDWKREGGMLSVEENERMTRVGRGPPMGELLRRYWHPIAAATEFDDKSTKQVRLLGEDLVLYKDRSGSFGLLALHCPHRRADLSYGFVEEHGRRCSYHGWAFDEQGNCLAAPFEDTVSGNERFREQIKQPAYPVEEMAGLLFAYMGPLPAPLCPHWETFTYENVFKQIVFSDIPCNWLQAAENNIDPVHFGWLHNNWPARQLGQTDYTSPTHVEVAFDEWEFGFGYRRLLEGSDKSSALWNEPRYLLLPNVIIPECLHFEYRVPVDDTHSLSVVWHCEPVPLEQRPFVQERIPYWWAPMTDPVTGRWITSHVMNQDTIAWVGQGPIADRENEHLGRSDVGVVMFRNQLLADLDAVARGADPKGVFRDQIQHSVIHWPDSRAERIVKGVPKAEWPTMRAKNALIGEDDHFLFYAGQPDEVRRAFEAAMGLA